MYFKENIRILKSEFPGIPWDAFEGMKEDSSNKQLKPVRTRNGCVTLTAEQDGKVVYIHSKYEPVAEAEKIVEAHELIEEGKHIVFYGLGMGYLVQAFIKKYPNVQISIYEPSAEAFYLFICNVSLKSFPIDHIKHLFIEGIFEEEYLLKYSFFVNIHFKSTLVTLPSYARIFETQFEEFCKEFHTAIVDTGINFRTRYLFEKKWMTNYIHNLPSLFETPNIRYIDTNVFEGKPILIVSAGPSLIEEMERIRFIKNHKLAYIFSVGSAIKALLAHNIYPDAICAIDGNEANYALYNDLLKDDHHKVSLIYGTSLFHKVVNEYKNPRIGMIISKDSVSNYYLKVEKDESIETIQMAPSVALVTLQLVHMLKFSPIILVGQNFAFKNERYYSEGIQRSEGRSSAMVDTDKKAAFLIEDVHGGMVYTRDDLDLMRRQMELIVASLDNATIINTTQGGAKIQGVPFEPLQSVIEKYLNKPVVTEKWYEFANCAYDMEYLVQRQKQMEESHKELSSQLESLTDVMNQFKKTNRYTIEKKFRRLLEEFSHHFIKVIRNDFYKVFIFEMNTVQHDILLNELEVLEKENDLLTRVQKLVKILEPFLDHCNQDMEFLSEMFEKLSGQITQCLRGIK